MNFPDIPAPRTIGRIQSSLSQRENAPLWGSAQCPRAWIVLDPAYAEGVSGLEPGQNILVITWLDRADRSTLQCHPQGDPIRPIRGVFSTRSPDRPNPFGLHAVRIENIKGNRLEVWPLEALDGTPVMDIKSHSPSRSDHQFLAHSLLDEEQSLLEMGKTAWKRGLMSGMNGNISLRVEPSVILITASGTDKGHLKPRDLALVDLESGAVLRGGKPSSEAAMHLEIYHRQSQAKAILHTHPPHLLACWAQKTNPLFTLDLFEASKALHGLSIVPAMEPGTLDLAQTVGKAAADHRTVFLERHGLVAWGEDPGRSLAASDELEALARTALLGLNHS
jgi:L-fuculose-phosphate aldolase